MTICLKCNESFVNSKVYANHVRWKHTVSYKSLIECSHCNKLVPPHTKEDHLNSCEKNLLNRKRCAECNSEFISTRHRKKSKFCSSKCSATTTNRTKDKSFYKIKKEKESTCSRCNKSINIHYRASFSLCTECKIQPRMTQLICVVCNNNFEWNKHKKTCGAECKKQLNRIKSLENPNCGGKTNFKRFVYKDVIFDSSWEIEIAMFLDERNIEWKRSKEIVLFWVDSKQITRRYYPDFYLPEYNIYVDPKNKYKQKLDEEKINFIQNKYNLLVGSVEECKKQIILNINLQVC